MSSLTGLENALRISIIIIGFTLGYISHFYKRIKFQIYAAKVFLL